MNAVYPKGTLERLGIGRMLARRGGLIIICALLLVLALTATVFSPDFLTTGNITNVLRQASVLEVVSVGQTFVILTAGIDLSVGSVITVTSCVVAGVMQGKPESMIPAVLIALAIGLTIGLVNGLVISKLRLPAFIVTLGMLSFVEGANFVYTNGQSIGGVTPLFSLLSEGRIGPIPVPFVVWVTIAIGGMVLLGSTRTGRHIYAFGGNPSAARLSGVNVDLINTLVYVICALLATVAGLILAARLQVGFPLAGQGMELDSIASVVVGGTNLFGGRGGIGGTIVGALIISLLNNVFNMLQISPFLQLVFKGLIIIGVVALRSRGQR